MYDRTHTHDSKTLGVAYGFTHEADVKPHSDVPTEAESKYSFVHVTNVLGQSLRHVQLGLAIDSPIRHQRDR
jgi:hypothetical protein